MQHDNPDTIAIEDTPWEHTVVDDMFLPSVRVQVGWKDVESAVVKGAVLPHQAHALWASWASPNSGMRVVAGGSGGSFEQTQVLDREEDLAVPPAPGLLQRYGLVLGLVAGVALGAGGAFLLGG